MAEHRPQISSLSWKKLDTKLNRIAAVVTLVTAGAAAFSVPDQLAKTSNDISGSVTQVVSDNGVAVINQGDHTTIQIGLTEAELRKELDALRRTLSDLLLHTKDAAQVPRLQAQLLEAERQLTDLSQTLKDKKQQLLEANQALDKFQGELPEAVLQRARDALSKGDTRAAEQAFDSVVEKQGKSVALAAYESALLAESRIDYGKAIKSHRKAVAIEPENLEYLNRAGLLAYKIASYSEARQWLETTRTEYEKQGIENTGYATVLNNLAGLYESHSDYASAERLYIRALSIFENVLGENSPSVAVILNNLAGVYVLQGNYMSAKPLYTRALSIIEKALDESDPSMAETLHNLATFYDRQDEYESAEQLYRRSLRLKEKMLGDSHPSVAATLNNLANIYRVQGDYGSAELLFTRALSIAEKALGDSHPSVAATLNNLALLYDHQQKWDQALPLMERGLRIMEQMFPDGHPNLDNGRENYQRILEQLKLAGQSD